MAEVSPMARDSQTLHAVFCEALKLPTETLQKDVAEKLGIRPEFYSRLLRGQRVTPDCLAGYLEKVGLTGLAASIRDAGAAHRAELKKAARLARGFLDECVNLHVSRELGRLLGHPETLTCDWHYLYN